MDPVGIDTTPQLPRKCFPFSWTSSLDPFKVGQSHKNSERLQSLIGEFSMLFVIAALLQLLLFMMFLSMNLQTGLQ